MIQVEIAPEDERLLVEVIGKRLEPPRYGTFLVAVADLRGSWDVPGGRRCRISHDKVLEVLRMLAKWPHHFAPPTGWMVLEDRGLYGSVTARVYLVA